MKRGAGAQFAFGPYAAAMGFDNAFDNGEAEAHTVMSGSACLPEAIEQVRQVLGGNPGSGVGDREDGFFVEAGGAQCDGGPAGREPRGIAYQIGEYLEDTRCIDLHLKRFDLWIQPDT